jgi:hypothetical protein
VTVVDEVLQGDPVPVQHRERDVDSGEPVQTGGGGLQCAGGRCPAATAAAMSSPPISHSASAGSLASQASASACSATLIPARARISTPIEARWAAARSSVLSDYTAPCARSPQLRSVSDDANRVSEDVLVARDRPTLEIPRRDFDTKRGGDRSRPSDPLELCGVHATSRSRPIRWCLRRTRHSGQRRRLR